MHRVQRGFSLLELIVSIGIIGASLILVVGIFTVLISGSQKASDLTSGSVVADGLLSQTIYQVNSSSLALTIFNQVYSTPYLFRGGTYQLNNTVYFYKIYLTDVQAGNADLKWSGVDNGNGGDANLKRFDAVVWWNDASAAAQTSASNLSKNQSAQAQGQGVQEVHQMRILWPNGTF